MFVNGPNCLFLSNKSNKFGSVHNNFVAIRLSFCFLLLYFIPVEVIGIGSVSSNTTAPLSPSQSRISDDSATALAEDASIVTATINECHPRKSLQEKKLIVDSNLCHENISLTFRISGSNTLACRGKKNLKKEYFIYKLRSPDVKLFKGGDAEEKSSISFLFTGEIRHFVHNFTLAVTYKPNEYCVRRTHMEIQFCTSGCGEQRGAQNEDADEICIYKCCPPGYVVDLDGYMDTDSLSCQPSGEYRWTPTFYDSETVNTQRCISKIERNATIRYRHVNRVGGWCSNLAPLLGIQISEGGKSVPRSSFRLLDNGSLVFNNPRRNPLKLDARFRAEEFKKQFCIDGIQNFGKYEDYAGSHVLEHQLVLDCRDSEDNHKDHDVGQVSASGIKVFVYIMAFYISIIPLGFTVFAYWITWDAQNIHGWTVFSHIVALLLMNLCLGTSCLVSYSSGDGGLGLGCVMLGVLTHFFFLSTFCWLTMINFDLWWTFRRLKQAAKGSGFYRFLVYALFSYGGPLLVIVVGLSLDAKYGNYGEDNDCDVIVTNYGEVRCFFQPEAQGVYLYHLIGALNILNLGFFSATLYSLYKYRKSTEVAVRGKSTKDITSGELFIKLFVVMGASFTLEYISWAVESDYSNVNKVPWIWIIVDVINITVRAILICAIFACKPSTLAKLRVLVTSNPYCACLATAFPPQAQTPASSQISAIKMSSLN